MYFTSIALHALRLNVHLGWPRTERLKKQVIHLDVLIRFAKPPKGCITDHLNDTYCYDILTQLIKKNLANRRFHLVEHLGHEVYHFIKTHFPDKTRINIRVRKKPAIPHLTGGISFAYGDEDMTWLS